MSERKTFVARAVEAEANMSALCREYWISRKTGYKWLTRYHREGDVRLLTLLLPNKSPWLNLIEPCWIWIHAKRKVCEPDGELSADELRRRLCAHIHTDVQTAALRLSDFDLH